MPDQPSSVPAPQEPQEPQRRMPGQSWQSLADERIRRAMERGDFDNLPGAGKPVEIDENPYAGERALAFSLLKSHHLLPREIALGKDIDADLARAEQVKDELRWKRAQLLGRGMPTPAAQKAYNAARAKSLARYAALVREARSKTLTLNIIAPAPLHRPLIDATALILAFEEEFPVEEE
jgi:DnaJ family protein C protein 28